MFYGSRLSQTSVRIGWNDILIYHNESLKKLSMLLNWFIVINGKNGLLIFVCTVCKLHFSEINLSVYNVSCQNMLGFGEYFVKNRILTNYRNTRIKQRYI